jgi:ParB family transcriptional regulator, chromosome partitioning protein
MSKPKITLSASRDIPFNQLRLAASNVRRVKAGVSIEELAEDIARRTLLSSLTVRPVLDDAGNETGVYEIPAGGRRFRALELLVKQKRLAKATPIPCIIRTDGLAEEDSLAENVQRAPLHPLDQFRAFEAMREKGKSEEEIATAFFVSVHVVRQRLKLASVSPRLLDLYAEDELSLDQLMAFTLNPDHARQEQVWEALSRTHNREGYAIRRLLTETAVRASDKRVRFVGLDAYEAAGGTTLHDLFEADGGGWLQDVTLLEQLVASKLDAAAEQVRSEGWRWVQAAPEFPYGHSYALRRLSGVTPELTPEQDSDRAVLVTEQAEIEARYEAADELPDDIDVRLGEIDVALEAIDNRAPQFEPDDIARAGVFISIEAHGGLRIDRGYVRPEDEVPVTDDQDEPADDEQPDAEDINDDRSGDAEAEEEDDEPSRPLPDRLLAELSAHHTLALREALGGSPELAQLAALHALVLRLFYPYGLDSCLDLTPKCVMLPNQGAGLSDTPPARSLDGRHQAWAARLPRATADLWDALSNLPVKDRAQLFAHCIGLTVNALYDPYARRPKQLAHAASLASALSLNMVAAGWEPTADAYLARVTKAQILDAVEEACGAEAADRIAALKKPEMVTAAEELLKGTGWLPDVLRTAAPVTPEAKEAIAQSDAIGGKPAIDDVAEPADDEEAPYARPLIAAE